jgi:hypothetical protein
MFHICDHSICYAFPSHLSALGLQIGREVPHLPPLHLLSLPELLALLSACGTVSGSHA